MKRAVSSFSTPIAIAGIAYWACAVTGVREGIAAGAALAWFSLPGWVLARSSRNCAFGGLLPWCLAGLALTLGACTILGLLIGRFSPAGVFAIPVLLVALFSFVRNSSAKYCVRDHSQLPDRIGLAATALVGLALATPIWLRAGAPMEGGLSFQQFFNADFFKHVGIANSMALGSFPPTDLFGAGEPVHYYWLQHLIAGSLLAAVPQAFDPFRLVLAIGIWQTAAFGALLYLWARRLNAGPISCFLATSLALASLSMDGLAAFLLSGDWLTSMQQVNAEALDLTTALGWATYHPAASTLFRLTLYIPQHQLCALLFVAWALLVSSTQNCAASRWARLALVAVMPGTSMLLGLPCVAAAVLYATCRTLRSGLVNNSLPEVLGAVVAAAIPIATEMIVPGATVLGLANEFGNVREPSMVTRVGLLPFQWLTSIGVLLPAGLLGAFLCLRSSKASEHTWIPLAAFSTACVGYLASEILLSYSRLRIDVQLKLSFLMALSLVPLAAYAADAMRQKIHLVSAFTGSILILLGLPTLLHDLAWHRCQSQICKNDPNRSTTIPYSDWEALAWIRKNTDVAAVFQQSPQADFLAGGPDVWVPIFAARSVRASHRASNSSAKTLITEMQHLFDPEYPAAPSSFAEKYHIDYLYLSRYLEGRNFDSLRDRYGADPGLELVYRNNGADVWRYRKGSP